MEGRAIMEKTDIDNILWGLKDSDGRLAGSPPYLFNWYDDAYDLAGYHFEVVEIKLSV